MGTAGNKHKRSHNERKAYIIDWGKAYRIEQLLLELKEQRSQGAPAAEQSGVAARAENHSPVTRVQPFFVVFQRREPSFEAERKSIIPSEIIRSARVEML